VFIKHIGDVVFGEEESHNLDINPVALDLYQRIAVDWCARKYPRLRNVKLECVEGFILFPFFLISLHAGFLFVPPKSSVAPAITIR
jgi:hypothetical protein